MSSVKCSECNILQRFLMWLIPVVFTVKLNKLCVTTNNTANNAISCAYPTERSSTSLRRSYLLHAASPHDPQYKNTHRSSSPMIPPKEGLRINSLVRCALFWYLFLTYITLDGTAQSVWRLDTGRSRDRIPLRARFPPLVHTCPAAHPASNTMGTGSLPELKRPECGVDPPHHLAPRLKKE